MLDEWISNRSYMIRLSVFCIHIWVVIPDETESPVIVTHIVLAFTDCSETDLADFG